LFLSGIQPEKQAIALLNRGVSIRVICYTGNGGPETFQQPLVRQGEGRQLLPLQGWKDKGGTGKANHPAEARSLAMGDLPQIIGT
jgi:hypothetical protein